MAKLKEYSVPSIERALSVLECLAQAKRGFSLSEIGRTLRIPKSSAHLILSTLERRGFLQKNAKTGRYCFGLQLVSLSRSALENLDMRDEAKPFLCSLMQESGLTVHMAVLERDEAVIIEKVEAPGLVRLASWIGRRLDVNCTGVSKSALRRELKRIKQAGYSFDNQEDEPGVCCIGAPVFDQNGKAVAAISVAGIASKIATDRVPILARLVTRVAGSISARLGYIAQAASAAHQETSTGDAASPSEKW